MAKITLTFNLKPVKNSVKDVKKIFAKTAPPLVKDQILDDLSSGVSPVRGKRFEKYSKAYKDQIKKGRYSSDGKSVSPVNLKLSGDMIKTLFVKVKSGFLNKKLTMEVGFSSFLAKVHNNLGASKKKVIRRIVPKTGEKFNTKITNIIQKELKDAISTVAKKINRR